MKKILLTSLVAGIAACEANAGQDTKPNVVLILCDDMGFSDIGCYGGEVQTPNIDSLAMKGTRFSQFKNAGRSCPSRAALITGQYQHSVGMGWMTAVDEHRPGYRGQIDKKYPTIAELLKSDGYCTYMTGKWHLTVEGAFGAPNGSYPVERGFDRYYGCLTGGGSYYKPTPLYNDLERVTELPDDYYYTTAITDSAVSFINKHPEDKPMFLYVAYYAPHYPLQAPEERVKKCLDRYAVGFDVLREQRFERQKEIGLVPADMELPVHDREFGGKRPAWTDLTDEQREQWTREMATYAAMIEIMDDGIGEIVKAVKEKGMLDNTVFMFLSDNGASNEWGETSHFMADLSNTPYRSYKQWCFQGGTSTPFIFTYGDADKNIAPGTLCNRPAHIIDVMPTCLDLAGGEYVSETDICELPGISLLPALQGKGEPERTLYFEHQSSCAIISGYWKLVRADFNKPWELIDLEHDPYEMEDLSDKYPEKKKELEEKWYEWAETHNVLPLEENTGWSTRINHYKTLYPDQSGKD